MWTKKKAHSHVLEGLGQSGHPAIWINCNDVWPQTIRQEVTHSLVYINKTFSSRLQNPTSQECSGPGSQKHLLLRMRKKAVLLQVSSLFLSPESSETSRVWNPLGASTAGMLYSHYSSPGCSVLDPAAGLCDHTLCPVWELTLLIGQSF